jgi:hypothetical protein
MATYDTSPERQAFEAWMQERFPSAPLYRRDMKGSLRFGQYCSSAVEDQWETWKARGAIAAPLCEHRFGMGSGRCNCKRAASKES